MPASSLARSYYGVDLRTVIFPQRPGPLQMPLRHPQPADWSPDPAEAQVSRALLDALDHAVLYLDAQHRIVAMNQNAASLLAQSPALRLFQSRLNAQNPEEHLRLNAFLASLEAAEEERCQLDRCLLIGDAESRNTLRILAAAWRGGSGIAAVLLLQEVAQPTSSRASLMRSIFGITPSQARLADLLLQGMTLREAAASINLSYETARFHLKQIFQKTGVSRQIDLLRLMFMLPGDPTGPLSKRF